MSPATAPLPVRRPELLVRPHGDVGQGVAKDPHSGSYFHFGEEEHFLLAQLDQPRTAEEVCRAFAERFGQPPAADDLDEFIELLRDQDLVQSTDGGRQPSVETPGRRQSILYWRKSIFDPDRLFTRLEPKVRFFWTRAFLVASAACVLAAVLVVAANWREAVGSFRSALRWETAVVVWLTLLVVTTLHEFAHGLTCKHHGGEVHEIGFLLLFFMPCFFVNVSDAWLFRERSKRLWVTLAGGYFELFLWALAVFAWRATLPGTLVNHLAFVVVSVCGLQTLFNGNPLVKLDGYYLLSDWLEIPN